MEKPKQAEVNIGMVGHVDHGKTTLTHALTGKWTDTHSEELRRGISILLGYADAIFYRCPSGYSPEPTCPDGSEGEVSRRVSFVDAPGHEALMATMLSGAAIMDGAVLVIAANEPCPQPQTEEHLMALSIMGVKNLVVAQNKVDLVSRERALKNKEEIEKLLETYGYTAPIIPTSAHHRINIDALVEAIETHIPTPERDLSKPLRMYVARSFDVNKPGTRPQDMKGGVLGGSIIQGKVKVGDEIEISPGLEEPIVTEVVSLASETDELEEARPGGLIAIGTPIDPSYTKMDGMKGQVVGKPGTLPEPTDEISVDLVLLERKVRKEDVPRKPLEKGEPLAVAVGTMVTAGVVVDPKEVRIKLKRKVVAEKGHLVAVSRRVGARWRLTGYGRIL